MKTTMIAREHCKVGEYDEVGMCHYHYFDIDQCLKAANLG